MPRLLFGLLVFVLLAQGQQAVKRPAPQPRDLSGALALLSAGAAEIEKGQYEQGAARLKSLSTRLPQLRDYVAWYLGSAEFGLKNFTSAVAQLETVWKGTPSSPLAPDAILLAAKCHLANGNAAEAARLLKERYSELPQPDAALVLARALETAGRLTEAAGYYQHVYYGYPLRSETAEAASSLERLRRALGAAYPPPMPGAMLERAESLMRAGEHRKARAEFESLANELAGEERELAQVGIGVADYTQGRTRETYSYLETLRVESPEADAKRLYFLVACARRLGDRARMLEFIDEFARRHPKSRWRIGALIWAGNEYLLVNDPASYEPLFRACYESFPGEESATYCHWKIVWNAYLRRDPQAPALLREHLRLFPESPKLVAAIYYLGRTEEKGGNLPAARACYETITRRFPGHFYATLARERLSDKRMARVSPAAEVSVLANLRLPPPASALDFKPNSESRLRIERGRLLERAGLIALAEREMRFGAASGGQPHVLAAELAKVAARQGQYGKSVRFVKGVFPGYLSLPLNAAPEEFWKLAFPLPYRRVLERYCRIHKLDLWLIAGLIRQESEFDPRAVSRAGARGLMQILPSTGRQLSRRLGVRRFSSSMLYRPEFNIRLGTYYFRRLLDEHSGQLEAALASYNGGKNRVDSWLTWGRFEETAEFIETIPLSETRNYVQAVLRNAAVYRRLYGAGEATLTSTHGDSSEQSGAPAGR